MHDSFILCDEKVHELVHLLYSFSHIVSIFDDRFTFQERTLFSSLGCQAVASIVSGIKLNPMDILTAQYLKEHLCHSDLGNGSQLIIVVGRK